MNSSPNTSDELKTIREESQKLIGQSIVKSLTKKDHTIADFNRFFGSVAYYNQSNGNYTQTDGGNYTQGPAAMQAHDVITNLALIGNIRDGLMKEK